MSPSSPARDIVAPFRLKWAGGKRWLAEALATSLSADAFSGGLCEPFAGGAALFFATTPRDAQLGDVNEGLIRTYRAIQESSPALAETLADLTIDEATYRDVRQWIPKDDVECGARLIYLNRTAFGGLWRVNRRGEFNVPFGCKPETRLPSADELAATSNLFQNVTLTVGDFCEVSSQSSARLLYFDPPYTTAHNNNGFVRYNEKIFSWADQLRLAEHASVMADSGRHVVVSNAWHRDVRSLYSERLFKFYRVERPSNLASRPAARGIVQELLILGRSLRFRTLPKFVTMV